jgi:hypothetical protein
MKATSLMDIANAMLANFPQHIKKVVKWEQHKIRRRNLCQGPEIMCDKVHEVCSRNVYKNTINCTITFSSAHSFMPLTNKSSGARHAKFRTEINTGASHVKFETEKRHWS